MVSAERFDAGVPNAGVRLLHAFDQGGTADVAAGFAERQVEILSEGVMRMADRTLTLDSLLPPTFEYPFVDEPGVLRVYAQYRNKNTNTSGTLKLGIDSAAAVADRWKAALGGLRIVVDLGPFPEIMYVDGNFNAASGVSTKYDKPHLQFGPVLDPVVKILQILATPGEDLTEHDYAHMRKVIGFCRRHLAQRPWGDVTATRWRWSLMNWGHDPLKD